MVVLDYFTIPDTGFDWNSCCGLTGIKNLCPWTLSFALPIRAGCTWLFYFSWPRIWLEFLIWPRWGWESLSLERFICSSLSEPVVLDHSTLSDPGFDWNSLVAQVALRISVPGASHLFFCIKTGCTYAFYFSWSRIWLEFWLWPGCRWKSLSLEFPICVTVSKLVVPEHSTPPDPGFDWNFCVG